MRRLGIAALLIALVAAGRHAATPLVVADPVPSHADAIVVLAGSPADRVLTAADLYAAGVAPMVVLTRERHRREHEALARRGVRLPEPHELAAEALIALGVPSASLTVLPERAESTVTEAAVIARWACASGIRRLVVVTSPSHTWRSRTVLRRALGPTIDLRVRPTDAAEFPAQRWWRHRHAAKAVALEWQKLASYWLVERWAQEPCTPAGVSPRRPS